MKKAKEKCCKHAIDCLCDHCFIRHRPKSAQFNCDCGLWFQYEEQVEKHYKIKHL